MQADIDSAFCQASGSEPTAELRAAIASCVSSARSAYADVSCESTAFGAALARGLRQSDPLMWLGRVRAPDLWLAVACAAHQPEALRTLDRIVGVETEHAIRKARSPGMEGQDLKQLVIERLLVAREGAAAKLNEYIGEGDLRGWVRVIAVRALIDRGRKRSGTEPPLADDRTAMWLLGGDADPELSYLKQKYRAEFAAAFTEAIAELAPEDRLALRQQFVDKLSIDQVAVSQGIHRATAARRSQQARESLLADTRRRLMAKLRLSRGELESVMRLIESQLHVSVLRLLA